MDRKSILVLVVCFGLLMSWGWITNQIFPPQPLSPTNTLQVATQRLPASTNVAATPGAPAPGGPTGAVLTQPSSGAPALARPTGPEQRLVVTNRHVRYTFTSHGGGLQEIELPHYPEHVGRRQRGASTDGLAALNAAALKPALSLLGGPELQDDAPFALEALADGVRCSKQLTNGLRIVKEFRPSTNYLLKVILRIENPGEHPVQVPAHEWLVGTATPMTPYDDMRLMGVQWYDGSKAVTLDEAYFANRTLGCLPGTPRTAYLSPGVSNVFWASAHNQFFTLIAIPQQPAPQMVARRVDLPPPTAAERELDRKLVAHPHGFETSLLYPSSVVPERFALERQLDLYTGPKEYHTLARLGRDVDLAMGFSRFFGFFAKALLLSMNGLHGFGLSYGAAIIVITVIIKLLFWPLTHASTKSMKRMQQLQPQMKALQEKYKDDPKKMNAKLMEFMKEHRVNPLGGCLPLALQIPVFIGFYQMLQSAIELRGARFLWAADLSQPDTVAHLFGFPLNPLPLIMGATQFWQARLTPPSPGVDPMQQKIMQYMPLMFIVILYNFSAGLALYWTVQNLLSILQMKITRAGQDQAATPPPAPPRRAKA